MEFKKCDRCGAFFASNNNVCYDCIAKEKAEFAKFKNYLSEANIDNINSLNDLSVETGISGKNLNRFLNNYDTFSDVINQINLK